MVVAHQPKELSKLTQPYPGPRPAWSPCRFLGAKNERFQTEITRLPPPHPSKCVESWNETEYEQDVVYTMAVSICYMTEMHYG